MQKLLVYYLLIHHNLKIFFSASMIGIICKLGKFTGNVSFRTDIAALLSICHVFNFSVMVIKKLLKTLTTSVGYFNFLLVTSKVGTCYTKCILAISFFIMFRVVFILLLDFVISLLQYSFLASFTNFLRISQYLI